MKVVYLLTIYVHQYIKIPTLKLPVVYKSWRRDLVADIEEVGRSCGEIERMAQDRRRWRTVVGGLCPGRS